MVRTDPDLDNLPPEERLKVLAQRRKQKEDEIARLIKEKEAEMDRARQDIERTMQELIEEEEEQAKKMPALEEVVEREAPQEPAEDLAARVPRNLYELSDYNVYQELRRMTEQVEERGYLGALEQERLEQLRAADERIRSSYNAAQITDLDRQRGNYLQRTEDLLRGIDERLHNLSLRDHHAVYK